jgi:transposase
MPMHVQPFQRSAGWEVTPSLDALVAADHPVRFIAADVDSVSAAEWQSMGITWQEGGQGAHGYHPVALLALWLWGFMSGVRSSRRLEEACRDRLSVRWLSGGLQPDHTTLWRFYEAHRAGMRYLLANTVHTAVRLGLVDLALQAVDGTKIAGNASKRRTYDAPGLDRLAERVEAAITDLEAQNQTGGDPPPPGLPTALQQWTTLQEQVRAARTGLGSDERVNLTDPDARLMRGPRGFVAGYNAQAMVSPVPAAAGGGSYITAAEISTEPVDRALLVPMLAAAEATSGTRSPETVADSGYHSAAMLAGAQDRGQTVYSPEGRQAGDRRSGEAARSTREHFPSDALADTDTCPEGATLTRRRRVTRPDRVAITRYQGEPATCRACPAFGICTTDRHHGRVLEVSDLDAVLVAQRARMATVEAKAAYARRQGLIEPVFGLLKEQQAVPRFLLRGKAAVQAEWSLLATAFNLRVLVRIWRAPAA